MVGRAEELYLAGQSKSALFTAASSDQPQKGTLEQIKAHRELKRRKELLKAAVLGKLT